MAEKREATPGAVKLPRGAKDRERLEALEQRAADLSAKIDKLEKRFNQIVNKK